jgi:hypothetical protein
VSFLQRAKEAAEAAATSAQQAADKFGQAAADPAMHERLGQQAREAMSQARKGMATVVEKIDPSTLADLVIKATALQEKTNASLRDKRSPYRIAEISITASIPPGVSFVISRIDEGEILSGTAVSSEELLDTLPVTAEQVVALDGTTTELGAPIPAEPNTAP